ncbi:MAG: 50S ribosomal protein L13 [Nanoarchaeota archaeon]|nr:50S ribosomal protein L13 [Nanoarchaeota archaeon]
MIIDGKGLPMGRLASFAAKSALKGEEVIILNCREVIITGRKKNIEAEFQEERSKMGSSLKGPKHHRNSERIIKKTIRGMLPNHREGRGRIALKRIMCYAGVPKEYEGKPTVEMKREAKQKYIEVKNLEKRR